MSDDLYAENIYKAKLWTGIITDFPDFARWFIKNTAYVCYLTPFNFADGQMKIEIYINDYYGSKGERFLMSPNYYLVLKREGNEFKFYEMIPNHRFDNKFKIIQEKNNESITEN